jgi:hypothetical protein
VRDLGWAKRDVARDQPWPTALDESASRQEVWLAGQFSPNQRAERHERAVRLAEELAGVPEGQREAVDLRHWHGCALAVCTESTFDGSRPLIAMGKPALKTPVGVPPPFTTYGGDCLVSSPEGVIAGPTLMDNRISGQPADQKRPLAATA